MRVVTAGGLLDHVQGWVPQPLKIAKGGAPGLGMFGKTGKQLGQFGWIREIACPSENELYVGELLNWRAQKIVLEDRHQINDLRARSGNVRRS